MKYAFEVMPALLSNGLEVVENLNALLKVVPSRLFKTQLAPVLASTTWLDAIMKSQHAGKVSHVLHEVLCALYLDLDDIDEAVFAQVHDFIQTHAYKSSSLLEHYNKHFQLDAELRMWMVTSDKLDTEKVQYAIGLLENLGAPDEIFANEAFPSLEGGSRPPVSTTVTCRPNKAGVVDSLKEMFPHLGTFYATTLLRAVKGNMEEAVSCILGTQPSPKELEGVSPEQEEDVVLEEDVKQVENTSNKKTTPTPTPINRGANSFQELIDQGIDEEEDDDGLSEMRKKAKELALRYAEMYESDEFDDSLEGIVLDVDGKLRDKDGKEIVEDPNDVIFKRNTNKDFMAPSSTGRKNNQKKKRPLVPSQVGGSQGNGPSNSQVSGSHGNGQGNGQRRNQQKQSTQQHGEQAKGMDPTQKPYNPRVAKKKGFTGRGGGRPRGRGGARGGGRGGGTRDGARGGARGRGK